MSPNPSLRSGPTNDRRTAIGLALTALAAVAAGLLVRYTYRNAPTVPIWDGWLWIAHARTWLDTGFATVVGSYGLNNNEHLYFLPSLLFVLAGPWVDYSMRPFALAGTGLVVALGGLFYAAARSAGLSRFDAILVFLVVVSPRHYENLLIGFQFGVVLSVLSGAVAVYLADRESSRFGLPSCLLLAAVSISSSAVGVIALGLVLVVHAHGEWNRRRIILAVVAFGLAILAAAVALYAIEVMRVTYFDRIAKAFEGKSLAGILVDWIRILGGGVVADQAAPAVGVAIFAWLAVCLATAIGAMRRVSGLSGLALFSLLSTLAVACGRSPLPEVASRWAIYAAPAVAAALIWLLLRVPQRGEGRVGVRIAVLALVCFLAAANYVDAAAYARRIQAWATEVRISLGYLKAGGALSDAEVGRVNPGAPEFIRSLMQFYNERGPQHDPNELGLELRQTLPTSIAREATMQREGSLMLVTGPGYVFDRWSCQHKSGCLYRLAVELNATGAATVGIIVRRADGSERVNVNHAVSTTSGFGNETVTAVAAFGDLVDPYVFCFTSRDIARIRSFAVFSVRAAGSEG